MRNIVKIRNRFSVILLLAVIAVVFSVGDASAAGDIFATMRTKVATTLRDLRKIIFVVGAIGLITFTFAAIFGKISFKHLANICFSLFLVAMMSPFVRYFSGSSTALAELTYNNYLSNDNGQMPNQTVQGDCKTAGCPQSADGGTGTGGGTTGTVAGYAASGSGANTERDYDGGTLDEVTVIGKAPNKNNPLDVTIATKPDLSGITPPTINVSTTQSTEDTRTSWQKIKDTIKTVAKEGKKAYSTASSVYSAAKNVKTAVDNTRNAMGNMHGIEGILNAGTVASTSVQNIASNVQHAADVVGQNYTDKEGKPTANDKVGEALGQIVEGAKEGEDVFRTGTEITETTQAGIQLGKDIGSGKGLK